MNAAATAVETLSRTGYVLAPGTGRQLMLPAGPMTLKVDAEASGGEIAIWEDSVRPGSGPPLHTHPVCHELFLVLEGEFEFQLHGERHAATAGSFVFIPRGAVHTYRCTGDSPGRLLGMVTPCGLEQFYEAQTRVPPGEMTPELYAELGREHDMNVIGPPLGDR
jgi:quercetin dioxygenase-like cupin family protein